MPRISRRKLAAHTSARLLAGDSKDVALKELAAYMIESRRTSELELIVRDIETALLENGTAVATIVSARELSAEAKAAAERLVKQAYPNVTDVILREQIDESLIGGMRLELPDKQLDSSVKTKLEKLTV